MSCSYDETQSNQLPKLQHEKVGGLSPYSLSSCQPQSLSVDSSECSSSHWLTAWIWWQEESCGSQWSQRRGNFCGWLANFKQKTEVTELNSFKARSPIWSCFETKSPWRMRWAHPGSNRNLGVRYGARAYSPSDTAASEGNFLIASGHQWWWASPGCTL